MRLSSVSDVGGAVDWWFMYKVASEGGEAKGDEYLYYDELSPKGLGLSAYSVEDANNGALSNTLNQLINIDNDADIAWLFYNDENPETGKTNSSRGHTKGVLAFDLQSDSGFWLVHSTPKFPCEGRFSYPHTGLRNAQSFLCISLKNADQARIIAEQMVLAQQPNVYAKSSVPQQLRSMPNDARVQLLNDRVHRHEHGFSSVVSFVSAKGKVFKSIAKNHLWSVDGHNDFYNDLVSVVLGADLEVETWTHGKRPSDTDNYSSHRVGEVRNIDTTPLEQVRSYQWSQEKDHAKLAISDSVENDKHYVCVGDINNTKSQEHRSGGTVAFNEPALWNSLNLIAKR